MSYDFNQAIQAIYSGKKIRAITPHHDFILRDGKIDYVNPDLVKKYNPEMEPYFSPEEINGQWEIVE